MADVGIQNLIQYAPRRYILSQVKDAVKQCQIFVKILSAGRKNAYGKVEHR